MTNPNLGQTLKLETVDFDTPNGGPKERALIRLVGEPAGPAGVITLELDNRAMFVFDAAQPDQIVETLLRAPVQEDVKGLVQQVVGSEARHVVESEADGVEFGVDPMPDLATLGRLGLLYLVRDVMPVPTLPGLWGLEAAQLAHSVPHRLLQKHAIDELFGASENLENLQARFRNAPGLGRLVRSISGDMVSVDVLNPLDGLVEWFRSQSEQAPSGYSIPTHREVQGSFSIGWDQVDRGLVDLRENAVTIEPVNAIRGEHQGIRLSVLAQPGAAQKAKDVRLFAHIIDRSDGQPAQAIPFTLSDSGIFEAIGIVPKGIHTFDVFIADGLYEAPPTPEKLFSHRARRHAFRALFFERRSRMSQDPSLVDRASSHWRESAAAYDLMGKADLADKARTYAASGAGKVQPFAAELRVPVELI